MRLASKENIDPNGIYETLYRIKEKVLAKQVLSDYDFQNLTIAEAISDGPYFWIAFTNGTWTMIEANAEDNCITADIGRHIFNFEEHQATLRGLGLLDAQDLADLEAIQAPMRERNAAIRRELHLGQLRNLAALYPADLAEIAQEMNK
jgi:hypothetical protein